MFKKERRGGDIVCSMSEAMILMRQGDKGEAGGNDDGSLFLATARLIIIYGLSSVKARVIRRAFQKR